MSDHLHDLLEAYLEGRLTDGEADELRQILRTSPEARQAFWEYVEQDALIEDVLAEARGRDLAALDAGNDEPAAAPQPRVRGSWARVGALAALAAGLLVVSTLWRPAGDRPASAEAVATLHALAGDVRLTGPEGRAVPAVPGSELFAGQVLQVGDEDGRVELRFADGTEATLGSGTTIRLLAGGAAEGKGFHLERGAVQVQAPHREGDRPLVVTTDQARITAGETRFRLYQEGDASRMELAEGKARLEGQGGRAVDLAEGLFVVVRDEPEPMVPHELPAGRYRLRHTFVKAADAVAFSPDGTLLAGSHFARGWKAWDPASGALRASAPGSGQRSTALAFPPTGETVLALGEGGLLGLWKVGEAAAGRTRLRNQDLRCGAVSTDGRWLAQGSGRGEVVVWEADPATGSITSRQTFALKPSRVALSVAGPHLAVSRWGGEIHVFEAATGREVGRHKLSRTPTPLALSPDARHLAAYATADGLVLFDRQADTRRTLWAGLGARVSDLHFSADGRVLLAGLEDGTVRAWDTTDGRVLLVLETGYRRVVRVTATADLALLATVGDNDCVKVWECQLP